MSLRCPSLCAALAATMLAAGLSGCTRESRRFESTAPASPGPVALSELQPGTPRSAATEASPYSYNAYAISQGKHLFEWYNCSGCHAHGGGDIGPPLMDDRWIYGSAPANLFATIVEGRPNGMPAFRGKIPDDQVWQLVAYVEALGGKLSRDAVPARDDHLFDTPGEQSLPEQPVVPSALPPSAQR